MIPFLFALWLHQVPYQGDPKLECVPMAKASQSGEEFENLPAQKITVVLGVGAYDTEAAVAAIQGYLQLVLVDRPLYAGPTEEEGKNKPVFVVKIESITGEDRSQ